MPVDSKGKLESDTVDKEEEEEEECGNEKEKLEEKDDDDNNDERESESRRQVSVGQSKSSQTVIETTNSISGQHLTASTTSTDFDQLEELQCDDYKKQLKLGSERELKSEFESESESKSKPMSMSKLEFDHELELKFEPDSEAKVEADLKPKLKPMTDSCNDGSNSGSGSNDEFGKVIFAPPRTRLSGAKSAKASKEEERGATIKPVAPPRARKRQSMPIVDTTNMRLPSSVVREPQLRAGSLVQAFKVKNSEIDGPKLAPERALSLDHEIDCASLSPSSLQQQQQQRQQQQPETSNEDDFAYEASGLQPTVVVSGGCFEKGIGTASNTTNADISNKEIKQQQQSSGNGSTILSSLFTKLRGKLFVL